MFYGNYNTAKCSHEEDKDKAYQKNFRSPYDRSWFFYDSGKEVFHGEPDSKAKFDYDSLLEKIPTLKMLELHYFQADFIEELRDRLSGAFPGEALQLHVIINMQRQTEAAINAALSLPVSKLKLIFTSDLNSDYFRSNWIDATNEALKEVEIFLLPLMSRRFLERVRTS